MRHSLGTSSLFALGFAFLAGGCGGSVGTEGRPAPDPRSPTSISATAFTQEDVAAALSACESPHGPVQRYTTVDELVALLSGAWVHCRSEQGTTLRDRDGIARLGLELTSDGHVYWLTEDAVSGVRRGKGLAGAAAYEIAPPTNLEFNDVSFQITVWYADRSTMGTYASFETGPRRLVLMGIDGYFMPLRKVLP